MIWEPSEGGRSVALQNCSKNAPLWETLEPQKLSSRQNESSIFTFPRVSEKGTQTAPKMEPKWSQNGSKSRLERVWERFGSFRKNSRKN